jgi:glycosyltransferase involved in cell wall biosynthesis
MKPILNIITAGSRVENLYKMEHSIKTRIKDFEVRWYIIFDRHRIYSEIPLDVDFYHAETIDGGKADCSGAIQKNRALELIEEGWIFTLDDDNKIHPDFNKTLKEAIFFFPKAEIFVFTQAYHTGQPRIIVETPRKEKKPLWEKNKMTVQSTFPEMGPIDAGQYVVSKKIVKETGAKYKPFVYDSDRHFFRTLYKMPGAIYIDKPVTYYNALRYEVHPDFRLTHYMKRLMDACECGPQKNDYTISEWANYDIVSYKNYEIISYPLREPTA